MCIWLCVCVFVCMFIAITELFYLLGCYFYYCNIPTKEFSFCLPACLLACFPHPIYYDTTNNTITTTDCLSVGLATTTVNCLPHSPERQSFNHYFVDSLSFVCLIISLLLPLLFMHTTWTIRSQVSTTALMWWANEMNERPYETNDRQSVIKWNEYVCTCIHLYASFWNSVIYT